MMLRKPTRIEIKQEDDFMEYEEFSLRNQENMKKNQKYENDRKMIIENNDLIRKNIMNLHTPDNNHS